MDSRSEISVSGGRIDMVAYTDNYVYVIEFKLDRPASEALAQIDDRGYLLKWSAEGRTVYKIGISFSSKHHTIGEYVYER
ncbi:MAG: PD-(D/E)XK nuclease domain-containing protein [Bacteroidales bacterium]|nr:PD-(D/E)XK nuclease domain-containing protein [Bacteroidales bacterium]